jgi:hypothetical protein
MRVPTNTIALTSFGAIVHLHGGTGPRDVSRTYAITAITQTYMHDPSISREKHPPIKAAVVIVFFAATRQRAALLLQMAQALPVLAINDAGAPGGLTACSQKGRKGSKLVSQYDKSGSTSEVCYNTYRGYTWGRSRVSQSSNHVSHRHRSGDYWHSCFRLLASEQCPVKHTK